MSLEAPETLVWVRLKGWPLWPARVIKNTQDGGVLLYTFGDHLHMWSKLEDIFAFTAADAPPSIAKATLHTQSKRNRLFAKALSEARPAKCPASLRGGAYETILYVGLALRHGTVPFICMHACA